MCTILNSFYIKLHQNNCALNAWHLQVVCVQLFYFSHMTLKAYSCIYIFSDNRLQIKLCTLKLNKLLMNAIFVLN